MWKVVQADRGRQVEAGSAFKIDQEERRGRLRRSHEIETMGREWAVGLRTE